MAWLDTSKGFINFLRDIVISRQLIFDLAKNDFKSRFVGSYLGIIWAFVQPLVTILVLWVVFQVGFKAQPIADVPFILWLICGMIPWFFFNDSLSSATNSLLDYSYLVSKVVFRVSVLPIVKIMSSAFVHVMFIFFIFIMFSIKGFHPSIYNLQLFYYSFACAMLLVGLSWFTSAIGVFFRDTNQVMSIILQMGFWLTPIFWSYSMVPEEFLIYFKFNPMFYIVEGYRDSMINHIWFWQHNVLTIYFWLVTLFFFIIGALIFKRLRPHFSDVL